jgi:hypothetical protein
MPHNRQEREAKIREQYEFVVFDGEFSAFNAALIIVDLFVTGGTFSLEYIKGTLGDFGEDVVIKMVNYGLDPLTETIYGGVMEFQTWESPFLPFSDQKVYGPDKYVPYIAARKKQPAPGPFTNYQQRGLETGTALQEVGSDNSFVFMLAPNLDIYAIKKTATGTNSTEVHVLSAASSYQQFSLQTGTVLHEVGADDSFAFMLAPNLDLYAIKKTATGSNSTEVHVLSAASSYQQFSLQTGTVLHEVGSDNSFVFMLAPNRDIYAIKKTATGTMMTEVHVLSSASGYQQFARQSGTALHEVGADDSFVFMLAPNLDIYAIKKAATGTNSTEVHILTAASNYQQFGLQTGTSLGEAGTDNRFAFMLAPNLDIFAILKSGTGTNSTEVHVLRR